MSIRKTSFVCDEYYHVYNRGNAKRIIFKSKNDYSYFLNLLYFCNTKHNIIVRDISKKFLPDDQLVSIGAYCLMPNHFHILIKEKVQGGVSKFLQKVNTGYVMYFNKKYNTSGGLFEGKFKSQHLDSDRYLRYIYSYIHLNPIKLIDNNWKENFTKNKREMISFISSYEYSSCGAYIDLENNRILAKESFPDYFSNTGNYYDELVLWISYHNT